jgi:hypothetical protein
MTRRRVLLVVVALLGLLSAAQVQRSLTVVGGLWWLIPSWDNSSTHQFESLASLTPPLPDRTHEAREQRLAAHHLLGHLPLPDGQPAPRRVTLSGRITRSPPASPAA